MDFTYKKTTRDKTIIRLTDAQRDNRWQSQDQETVQIELPWSPRTQGLVEPLSRQIHTETVCAFWKAQGRNYGYMLQYSSVSHHQRFTLVVVAMAWLHLGLEVCCPARSLGI